MFRAIFLSLFILFLGCSPVLRVPVRGGDTFSRCDARDCTIEINCAADSILKIEGARKAKAIFFANRIIVFGDGFKNIWIGEIEDNFVEFKREQISDSPVKRGSFDWQKQALVVIWTDKFDRKHRVLITPKGKVLRKR